MLHGFTLGAAETIARGERDGHGTVLGLLARLVDKSMLQVEHAQARTNATHGTEARYHMLETVRQFLLQRLIASGESEQLRARHLACFLALAEHTAPEIAFRDCALHLSRLEAAHANLEAALAFADGAGRREEALRLATALALFWELRGHLGRGGRWLNRLLEQPDATPCSEHGRSARARACWGAAHIGLYAGDLATMSLRAPEALELAQQASDDWARARALNTLGFATAVTTPRDARPLLEQSIALGLQIGDEWCVHNSRKMLTVIRWVTNEEDAAAADLATLRTHATRLEADYFLAWYHGLVGMFLARRGDTTAARAQLTLAIELCDGIGEPITGSMARAWLWGIDILQGEYARTTLDCRALLQRCGASGGGLAMADLLANLGQAAIARGDVQETLDLLAAHYTANREHGIPYCVVLPALVQAEMHRRAGGFTRARELLDDLQSLATGFDNQWMLARIELERGLLARDTGDAETAERHVHVALSSYSRLHLQPDIAAALEALGSLAQRMESHAEAARCFAAAAGLRARIGIVALPPDASAVADACVALRGALGEHAFETHWQEGTALSADEAVEYVTRARGERKRPSSGWASLTPTEQRVVALVSEGLTNPQIAERMFIARGTVKVHLSHVFTKLGIASRAELAARAVRRALE